MVINDKNKFSDALQASSKTFCLEGDEINFLWLQTSYEYLSNIWCERILAIMLCSIPKSPNNNIGNNLETLVDFVLNLIFFEVLGILHIFLFVKIYFFCLF